MAQGSQLVARSCAHVGHQVAPPHPLSSWPNLFILSKDDSNDPPRTHEAPDDRPALHENTGSTCTLAQRGAPTGPERKNDQGVSGTAPGCVPSTKYSG